jgi:hypothetical protein
VHNNTGVLYSNGGNESTIIAIVNCTFKNITSTYSYPNGFTFSFENCPFVVANCSFLDYVNTYTGSSTYGTAINFPMKKNFQYDFSGNIFYNISGHRHAVRFCYEVSSITFRNNSFQNIISHSFYGGVFLFCLILF